MNIVKLHSPSSDCNVRLENEHIIISEMLEKNDAKYNHGGSRAFHSNLDNDIIPLSLTANPLKQWIFAWLSRAKNDLPKIILRVTEQEERRMSNLTDFCWSVASSLDTQPAQLSTLAAEQELCNLRKECEEKHATIKELTTAAHSSNVCYSKRITELEEVMKRKNLTITKLKKDMFALEQRIVKFTRLRRPSYASSSLNPTINRLPFMTENILYDMSSTSPSSSDCDSPQKCVVNSSCISTTEIPLQSVKHWRLGIAKVMGSSVSTLQHPMSPLKENRMSRKVEANASV